MLEFARFLAFVLSIYNMLIVIRILLTWIRIPQTGATASGGFSDTLGKIVDPYLDLFKRFSSLRRGNLDFTPLAALMVLNILQRICSTYAISGKMTVGYILTIIVQSLWWSIGSLVVGLLCVLLAIRLFFCYRRTRNSIQYITILNNWLNPVLNPIHRVLFKGREISDKTLVLTTLLLTILSYVVLSLGVNLLTNWLMALPF